MSRPKVSAFIVGAQKSGTTALYSFLEQHPQIQFGIQKELHIFDNERLDWSGSLDHVYDECFETVQDDACLMDATPIYMYWPNAIARLHRYNPQAKLIVLLRDPIERAYSQWKMEFQRGNETLSFSDAIRQGRNRFDRCHRIFSYLERGLYTWQLENIFRYFPREQVLILRQTALLSSHNDTLQTICDFIEVERFAHVPAAKEVFASAVESRMSSQDECYLTKFFELSNKALSTKFGIDFTSSKDLVDDSVCFVSETGFPISDGLRVLDHDLEKCLPMSSEGRVQWFPYLVTENLINPLLPKIRRFLARQKQEDNYNNTYGQLGKLIAGQILRWNQKQNQSFDATVVMLPTDMEYPYDVPDDIICLRTSMVSYKRRPQDISMPLPQLGWEEACPVTLSASVGFCGVPNHPSRKRLLAFLHGQTQIPTDFIFRDRFWGRIREQQSPEAVEQMRVEYERNLQGNVFVVCSRGAGNYSIRFYETLRAGRIPIMLDTDMVFPLDELIDYSEFVICERTPQAVLDKMVDWSQNRDLAAIQRKCREIWEEYLYMPSFLKYLPAKIQRILR